MPNKKQLFTPDILQMFDADMDPPAIAAELDVSITLVYRVLKESNRDVKRPKTNPHDTEIVADYTRGVIVREILEEYNISYTYLYGLLARTETPLRQEAQAEGISLREDRAVEMYEAGRPLWAITQETGFYQPKIHAILRARGIPLRLERRKGALSVIKEATQIEEGETTGTP